VVFLIKPSALKIDVIGDLIREPLSFCSSEWIQIVKSPTTIIVMKSQWISRWY